MTAAQGLLSNVPQGSPTPPVAQLAARAHYVVAMLENGHGNIDSALAHAERAVALDSTIRPNVAVVYLIAGGKIRADTAHPDLPRAIELLTRARESIPASNQRLMANASFQLGVSQFSLARQIDQQAESSHDCEQVRRLAPLWEGVSANIAAGASINRDIANQILTAVPQYQSRASAFARNFRCS